MEINNPQTFDHIEEANGDLIKCAVVDIGAWNMDLVDSVDVDVGVAWDAIIQVGGYIANDSDYHYFIGQDHNDENLIVRTKGTVYGMTHVRLYRLPAGSYDNANFDDGVMNRGKLIVWYID